MMIDRLPHRPPFLFVTEVVCADPAAFEAAWHVEGSEEFLRGHFPGNPIVPGVLIVEALAQTAGVLAIHGARAKDPAGGDKLVFFLAIENAKFRTPVEPGCLLHLKVQVVQDRGRVAKFTGRAEVDGKLVAECSFTAMIADPPAA